MCIKDDSVRTEKGEVVKTAGGLGMILANAAGSGEEVLADAHVLPVTAVGQKAGDIIRRYVLTDPNPTASILVRGTVVNVRPSPMVAAFSSRGPNTIMPNILKPDLIAPGVNILAAWTGALGPSGLGSDTRRTANRSSTSRRENLQHRSSTGHVSPTTAVNRGLIYDLTTEDYIDFICASNYNSSLITIISRGNYACPRKTHHAADLNYPSFAVNVKGSGTYKYTRTVTNVGGAGSYSVKVTSETTTVKISVEPAVLNFKEVNEKKLYSVTFTVISSKAPRSNSFGSIEWSDGKHVVASPVAIRWT
ncbi:hypothetical protein DY000_02011728 [Brassica cretica]|uniref:Subtilisin-like protease fibronectin type-III domain-containing protein n=1 Tax=Brassica cretica TaxID=69181 RepID=A0ABQ7D5L8_BRACR|nr:hypothetical protein DY000_02011728 [Brassica cretica]